GMGIAPEDQARIFDEFGQVEHAVQRRVKGTGLGLALSRRLATILGGTLSVESVVGEGSTFRLEIPVSFTERAGPADPDVEIAADRIAVLVVDDSASAQHVYARLFRGTEFEPLPARTLADARTWLASGKPRAVILDVKLFGEDSWQLLAE